MSVQSDVISGRPKKPKKTKKSRARKVWLWVGYALFVLLFLLIILILIAWDRRYAIAERYVQTFLQNQGIEASLSIDRLTRESVILRDIKLTYQSEERPFFSAKRIEADYLLKDALNGKMKRLKLIEPSAYITLDKNFRIIDGWLPPQSSDNPSGISIPENGFFLEDASFELETPYGSPEIAVTAAIRQTDLFEATILISPTALNYQNWQTSGSARLDLNVSGNEKEIDALIQLDTLTGESLTLKSAALEAGGVLRVDTKLPINLEKLDMDFQGNVKGSAGDVDTKPFNLKDSAFSWSGELTRNTASVVPIGLNGDLSLSTRQFSIIDKARARGLAETLTLYDALTKTPIAQHFSPSVTKAIENMLHQSSVETSAALRFDTKGADVKLTRPLIVKSDKKVLQVDPVASQSIYNWDRDAEILNLSFNAKLNLPVPMTLNETYMQTASNNGWRLQGVKAFTGRVATAQAWRVTSGGEPARLSPFNASLNYDATQAYSKLQVTGDVDFDGRVPGGYVTGLRTGGMVDLRLAPDGQSGLSLSYRPNNPNITIASVSTDTDWRLDDVSLDLTSGTDIFSLTGNKGRVQAQTHDVELTATNILDNRSLALNLAKLDAAGELNTVKDTQSWDFDFETVKMTSDTVPVENTVVDIPKGQLTVSMADMLMFDFKTPSLDMRVPQGTTKGVTVSASGTVEAYNVTHSGGRFQSTLADIPQWPVEGQVSFEEGMFTGAATALIPQANNTPVGVTYTYAEGEGAANIVLESLMFQPRGLQPQTLVPALSGKIAAVEGEVSADLNLQFKTGQPLESDGVLNIKNMNFGTAPGPVTGLNTEIKLTSLLPLQTAGRQTLTVENFDPGFPLVNGAVEYELVPEGVKIYSATWPMGVGSFVLDPFTWKYGAPENRVVMRLNEIPIEEFLNSVGNGKLQATGTVRGEFPIIVRGINVLVDKGFLEAKDGGIIRYAADEGEAVTYSQEEALNIIRRQDSPQYRSLARDALREFTYRQLTASIDGPLDGDVQLGVIFDGTNKKVLNGQPFEFDIDVQGELFNILRSFNSNTQIKSELLRQQAGQGSEP